jgi:methionine-S-sulfoxide reductase
MSSGHVEAVLIVYNETLISITKVLEHFFRIINPTEVDQQGHDIGVQYRNAIFFFDPGDVPAIQAILRNEQSRYVKKLATVVKPAGVFWPAEDYHQDYLVKNPSGYCHVNMRLAKPEELK